MTPLLRCLGNICSGEDEYTLQACENPRLLHTLLTFLNSTIRHIVKECLWVLSNMAGKSNYCTSRHSKTVISFSLIFYLGHLSLVIRSADSLDIRSLTVLIQVSTVAHVIKP